MNSEKLLDFGYWMLCAGKVAAAVTLAGISLQSAVRKCGGELGAKCRAELYSAGN